MRSRAGHAPGRHLPRRVAALRGRRLRHRRVPHGGAPLRRPRRGGARDGARESGSGARRRHRLHGRRDRAGRDTARPVPRPELHRGRVAPLPRGGSPRRRRRPAARPCVRLRGLARADGVRGRGGSAGRGASRRARRGRAPDARQDRAPGNETDPDGDPRRQRHAARRPGPHRLRGALPRPAEPRLRHEPRRRRDAGEGRPGRGGRPRPRHRRRGGLASTARTRR